MSTNKPCDVTENILHVILWPNENIDFNESSSSRYWNTNSYIQTVKTHFFCQQKVGIWVMYPILCTFSANEWITSLVLEFLRVQRFGSITVWSCVPQTATILYIWSKQWLHINKVFPRHNTSFSPYLLLSHYRQLRGRSWACVPEKSFTQIWTHLCPHTHTRTDRHTHAILHWSGHWRTGKKSNSSTTNTHMLTYGAH